MWDEEKFFADFVKESERIEPDSGFVDRMQNLAKEERKEPVWKKTGYRVLAVAAAFAIICMVGIRFLPGVSKDDSEQVKPELQAGDVAADKEAEYAGSIGELANQELDQLKELLADDACVVTDASGEEIQEEEKQNLRNRINTAEQYTDGPIESGETVVYQIGAEDAIKIEIVDDKYLVLAEGEKIYLLTTIQ